MNGSSISLAEENSSIWLPGLKKTMQQMTIVNKNIEETFECNICAIKLKSKYYLQKHIEVLHNNVKNFVCSICPKHFGFNFHLQRHIESVHNIISRGT
jgi:transcription elongation factor Elf1